MRNKSSNTIEINGKRYDAVTGSLLGHGSTKSSTVQAIDGFTRNPKYSSPKQVAITKSVASRPTRKAASHVAAHRPEHARTLMRSAVKKPDLKASSKVTVHIRTDNRALNPAHIVAPKLSHTSIDPVRQKRAQRVIQSPAVSRFGKASSIDAIAPFAPTLHLTPANPSDNGSTHATPLIPVAKERAAQAKPDIFAAAIANSTSHTQTYKGKKQRSHRGRLALATSVSLVFLLVLGLFAYVNVPSISVRLASAKAGFQAKLPTYSPAGYSFGTLSYGPGNVTVSYQDDAQTNQQFDITQRASGWDNNALLNNFVASANKAYQTYQRAGRTIYLYGDNTATWVDSGVWYTVDGHDSLSRGQLLDLVGSL